MAKVLSPDELKRDVAELRRVITDEWLLANTTPYNYAAGLDALEKLDHPTTARLCLEIQKLLAHSADGHAASGYNSTAFIHESGKCFLPFASEPVGDNYAAVDPSEKRRNQLWNPDWPYVIAIDGVPIGKWIDAARPYDPVTHDLAARAHAGLKIRYLGHFRKVLGLPAGLLPRIMAARGARLFGFLPRAEARSPFDRARSFQLFGTAELVLPGAALPSGQSSYCRSGRPRRFPDTFRGLPEEQGADEPDPRPSTEPGRPGPSRRRFPQPRAAHAGRHGRNRSRHPTKQFAARRFCEASSSLRAALARLECRHRPEQRRGLPRRCPHRAEQRRGCSRRCPHRGDRHAAR